MRHSTSRFRTLTVIPPSGASIFFQGVATSNACNLNPDIPPRTCSTEKEVARHHRFLLPFRPLRHQSERKGCALRNLAPVSIVEHFPGGTHEACVLDI